MFGGLKRRVPTLPERGFQAQVYLKRFINDMVRRVFADAENEAVNFDFKGIPVPHELMVVKHDNDIELMMWVTRESDTVALCDERGESDCKVSKTQNRLILKVKTRIPFKPTYDEEFGDEVYSSDYAAYITAFAKDVVYEFGEDEIPVRGVVNLNDFHGETGEDYSFHATTMGPYNVVKIEGRFPTDQKDDYGNAGGRKRKSGSKVHHDRHKLAHLCASVNPWRSLLLAVHYERKSKDPSASFSDTMKIASKLYREGSRR